MRTHQFEFNPFREHTYLLWDEHSREAAVVDAGMSTPAEEREFAGCVEEHKLHLVVSLQTHCHFDHIYGLPFLYERYGLRPRFAPREQQVYDSMPEWARMFGAPIRQELPPKGDFLGDGEVIHVGSIGVQVILTPGHTPGGVSFYIPGQHVVFTGDTLFCGSMGRTDLGGNEHEERQSILRRLLTLPPDTVAYPGHGPSTTIADEQRVWGV